MNPLVQASALLAGVEASLRGLIEGSLRSENYGAIPDLARLAEGVAQLRRSVVGQVDHGALGHGPATTGGSASTPEPNSTIKHSNLPKASDLQYPHFQREADKLVKIGWSERDKGAYEHRAPRDGVLRVCEEINRRSSRSKRFRMDDILPELTAGKHALPTYQAYLTLAWLRSLRAIDRDGKDGYRVKSGPLSADRVLALWEAVDERL